MEQVIDEIGFEGDLRQFIKELREDERFHPKSAEHLMKEVSFALKQMDGKRRYLIGTLTMLSLEKLLNLIPLLVHSKPQEIHLGIYGI